MGNFLLSYLNVSLTFKTLIYIDVHQEFYYNSTIFIDHHSAVQVHLATRSDELSDTSDCLQASCDHY